MFARFSTVASELQTMAFLPRALELQQEAITSANAFLADLSAAKQSAVAGGHFDLANSLLSMELAIATVRSQIEMCIALKEDRGEAAWNHLVAAQVSCRNAARVREQSEGDGAAVGLWNLLHALLGWEQLVFPPQVFMSVGGIALERQCSVCALPYDDCSHVKGRAYGGQLCTVVVLKMSLREVSIVDEPANKHARVTHFGSDGASRNKMTWRVESPPSRGEQPGR